MASAFLDWAVGVDRSNSDGYSIAPGVVTDNTNFLLEGRVQVRIPSLPSFEPWARMVSVGAGSSRGFMWLPQMDDEVLVGFNQNDERDAYILGGLWSTIDRPPTIIPTDFLSKRILKTGLAGGLGHSIEFDDALQSVTIETSTQQTITIDPKKIEIATTGGVQKLVLDLTSATVSVEVAVGNIELKAPLGTISLKAMDVSIEGTLSTTVSAGLECSIKGLPVKLN